MHLRIALVLLLTLLIFEASEAKAQEASPVEPATLRAVYDSAFTYVRSLLPQDADQQSSPYWPIWALARFKDQSVGWAELRGEAYRSVAAGRFGAWLVVVPEGSPAHTRMGSRMQIDPYTDLLVAQIAPERISQQWAGVFLWRQLSILADYALGAIEKPSSDEQFYATEFRGYQVELMVADLLSKGAARQKLDALLEKSGVSDVQTLAKLLENVSEVKSVIAAIPAPQPGSLGEAELRGGFVKAALIIRFCELRGLDAVTALPVMQKLIPRK
ncbi:MAG: hypothetical protein JXR49_08190 [Acidobacteria bacterium]|nr:hypothetical protein [Acidobacteriota bacterium]